METKIKPLSSVVIYTIFIIFAILALVPLFWLAYSSLKTNLEIMKFPLRFPAKLQWTNFSETWKIARLGRSFLNSTIYMVFSVIFTILFGMMTGYAFAKMSFPKMTKFFYVLFLLGILISIHSIIIPLFVSMKTFHLVGTRTGLIIVYVAFGLPLVVFLGVTFIKGLPDSLIESAFLDGASDWRVFFSIILPLSRPVISTIAIMTAMGTWNDFLLGFILSNNRTRGLPVGIFAFANSKTPSYNLQFAGLVIAIIPIIVLYAFFHRKITEGIVAGAVKE